MSVARRFYIRIMAHHLKRDASHSGDRFVTRRNKKFSLIPVAKSPSRHERVSRVMGCSRQIPTVLSWHAQGIQMALMRPGILQVPIPFGTGT